MARPVIVDDGGSIRIKCKKGDGKMDDLLAAGAQELEDDPSYSKAFIGFVEEAGASNTYTIGPFKTISVSTDSGKNIEVKLDKQGKLKIKVSGSPNPAINPHFSDGKFSYTVVNGGNINSIKYKDQNNADHDFAFPGATVYMGVIIT